MALCSLRSFVRFCLAFLRCFFSSSIQFLFFFVCCVLGAEMFRALRGNGVNCINGIRYVFGCDGKERALEFQWFSTHTHTQRIYVHRNMTRQRLCLCIRLVVCSYSSSSVESTSQGNELNFYIYTQRDTNTYKRMHTHRCRCRVCGPLTIIQAHIEHGDRT